MNETPEQGQTKRFETELPTEALDANPWNRKAFDNQAIVELSESIKARGILEPLIVRNLGGGKFQIASGERRWRAAKLLGLKMVPCRIMEQLTDGDVQDMNLTCNIQREDIPALEKAAMVQARMEANHWTPTQMAASLGKSDEWVSSLLQVLSVPEGVQANLKDYQLGVRPMAAIAALPNSLYQEQIVKELQTGKIKPEHVERRAHELGNVHKASEAKKAIKEKAAEKRNGANAIQQNNQTAEQPNGGKTVRQNNPKSELPTAGPGNGLPLAVPPLAVPPLAVPPQVVPTSAVPPQVVPPGLVGQMVTAGKNQAIGQILAPLGSVGGVLQKAKGLKTWQVVLLSSVGLFGWHLFSSLISWPMRMADQLWNRASSTRPAIAGAPAAPAPETANKFTIASLVKIPAPTGLKAEEILSGQRVRFSWNPVPGCAGYNFYSIRVWDTTGQWTKETKQPLPEPHGVWRNTTGRDDYKFVATAVIDPDHESAFSEPVEVDMRQVP